MNYIYLLELELLIEILPRLQQYVEMAIVQKLLYLCFHFKLIFELQNYLTSKTGAANYRNEYSITGIFWSLAKKGKIRAVKDLIHIFRTENRNLKKWQKTFL